MSETNLTAEDARGIVRALALAIDTGDIGDELPDGFRWEFDEVDWGTGDIGEFFVRGYTGDGDDGVEIALRVHRIEYGGSSLTFTGYDEKEDA